MSLTFTLLGCGSSGGVPRIGGIWGACDPANPRNRRRRAGALVSRRGREGATHVLIDTSPDVREQLIDAKVASLDAVLFTHDHADHTHGIDDLRGIAFNAKRRIDVYFDEPTRATVVSRFRYCFEKLPGSSYPPILNAHTIVANAPLIIGGKGGPITFVPFAQAHGDVVSLGFRVGRLAYSSDIVDVPPASRPLLEGLDVWVVDALRYTAHPAHFSVEQALEWIERVRPGRAILTHLTAELDYETLRRELPEGVEPAYDGITVEITE